MLRRFGPPRRVALWKGSYHGNHENALGLFRPVISFLLGFLLWLNLLFLLDVLRSVPCPRASACSVLIGRRPTRSRRSATLPRRVKCRVGEENGETSCWDVFDCRSHCCCPRARLGASTISTTAIPARPTRLWSGTGTRSSFYLSALIHPWNTAAVGRADLCPPRQFLTAPSSKLQALSSKL